MTDDKKTPESESSDYQKMEPYWKMVETILGGTAAMREAGEKYLPKFPHEAKSDYEIRRRTAKFTNIFADIVDTLASKPFEKEVSVKDAGPVEPFLEDIDGQGNHIHVWSANAFHAGVADAFTWLFVDYTRDVPPGATVAQERAIGARPYWIHLPACRVKAVYSETIGGKETIVHARIEENSRERDGWGEREIERVRVIDREVTRKDDGTAISAGQPVWSLYEERKNKATNEEEWVLIGQGQYTIEYIPLFAFVTGKREGNSWVVRPPLQSAAYLQIEHYQQESELKHARQMSAFPMLAGNGVTPPVGDDGKPVAAPIGPMSVLYAPPDGDGNSGEWTFIEPSATSLEFLSREVDKTEAQLRELGRQPLTSQSGNITTITAAFAGDKAHTVIEAWALNFKDFLENGLKATADWIKSKIEPVVDINTDFALALKEDTGMDNVDAARERGDISHETWFDEAKRRGIIGPNITFEDERERILAEMPGDPTDGEMIDAVTPDPAQQQQDAQLQ